MNVTYPQMTRATIYTTKAIADKPSLRTALAGIVGGFTITYGVGGWSGGNGVIVEESANIVLMHADPAMVRRAVDHVAKVAILHGEEEVWATVDREVDVITYSVWAHRASLTI